MIATAVTFLSELRIMQSTYLYENVFDCNNPEMMSIAVSK